MYNFSKTSHDANWREFKQPLFRKGQRNLLCLITRKTQQKNQNSSDKDRNQGSELAPDSIGKLDNRHVLAGQQTPAIDPLAINPSNGDLIALIFELQNKLHHMEARLSVMEEHLLHCPHLSASIGDNSLKVEPPCSSFHLPKQPFREDNYQQSISSTRQNSESGSMCSELGSLLTTRSRSTTMTDKVGFLCIGIVLLTQDSTKLRGSRKRRSFIPSMVHTSPLLGRQIEWKEWHCKGGIEASASVMMPSKWRTTDQSSSQVLMQS
jgi:hypothetical protein